MATRARELRGRTVLVVAGAGLALAILGAGVLRPSLATLCLCVSLVLFPAGIFLAEIHYRRVLAHGNIESETLRESELRFRIAFQEAAVGMVILDVAGRIQSVNRGFADITLYSAEELTGKRLSLLVSEENHAELARDRRLLIEGKVGNYRAERRFIRKDGVSVWVRTSVSLLQVNAEQHTVALVEDITDQKLARETLNLQAMHDPLTGLPNRRQFEEALDIALALAKNDAMKNSVAIKNTETQRGGEVAILYVDLDGFKLVNDTMGHGCGDLLLKEVAARIRDCLEDSDLLARVGGDEFTVVLTGLDGPEVPARVARRLLQSFNSPFQIGGREIGIGASVGISRYPLDGSDSSALLQNADTAMYCAKRSGNNRCQFFTSQMRQDAHQRLTIESRLRRALDCGEISVQYQPQYELAGNHLVGFEALCRWFNPELGHVPPDRFIPIAEETGLIVAIGDHVLREACRQALKWQAGLSPVHVAVNVSAVQFTRAGFVNSVVEILRETGLRPALLELELTESALMRDRDDGIRRMQRLRDLGVHISIDDFGTGYSSLSYLQNMPLDGLKIDRSFTRKLGSSQTALSMVRAIIAMASALGLRIVTEGVENSAQIEILRQLGCDDIQGYYCGRAEGAEASIARALRQTTLPDSILLSAGEAPAGELLAVR
jgi:diguanylate cyclase (GGDEF)-like protein/PAS domain S-box-containing protein